MKARLPNGMPWWLDKPLRLMLDGAAWHHIAQLHSACGTWMVPIHERVRYGAMFIVDERGSLLARFGPPLC